MCINPIKIKDPNNSKKVYEVPCGHCIECKRNYQNSWIIRLDEHLKSSNYKAVFFTLTYADEAIPKNYLISGNVYRTPSDYFHDGLSQRQCIDEETGDTLDLSRFQVIDYNSMDPRTMAEFYELQRKEEVKYDPSRIYMFNSVRVKDIQDWMKRCRKQLKKYTGKTVKYFISSEYGPHTFRPHYHGVLFGITKRDFDIYFKKDWITHFGRERNKNVCVISEDVDPSLNGMEYVSKYCSKGVFEHPLCSKDFFYFHTQPDGKTTHTEYHSKHYERCIEYFGVDIPLVDKPSKFISQGLGADFLTPQMRNYYAAGDDVNISKDITYSLTELNDNAAAFLGLQHYDCDENGNLYHKDEKHTLLPYYVKRKDGKYYTKTYRLGSEPIFHDVHCWEGVMFSDKLYERLKDISKKLKYNKNGKDKRGQERTYSYALPQYYRQKMFSAEIQHLLTCSVLQEHVDLYQEQFRQIQSSNPSWSDFEVASYIDCQEQEERDHRRVELSERLMKAYTKSTF